MTYNDVLVRSDLTGGAVNGGVNSRSLTDLTISQGLFMTEMNIASKKTRWFIVNSHLVHDFFTLHPGSHLRLSKVCQSGPQTAHLGSQMHVFDLRHTQEAYFIHT